MVPLSVLDLSPIKQGSNAAAALQESAKLAQHCERLGYRRYWLAEHHNMPGIASAATAVAIGHVASHTSTIRVGAGGIMLPNHAPYLIAEQFGTLEALFPAASIWAGPRARHRSTHRGRAAPQSCAAMSINFPQDVQELLAYLGPAQPGQALRAIPGEGSKVPVWILGSSHYGAQLAAALGLPYAFASHFAPDDWISPSGLYRQQFQPSPYLDKPYVMLGLNVFRGRDRRRGAAALHLSAAGLHQSAHRPSRQLPPPLAGYEETWNRAWPTCWNACCAAPLWATGRRLPKA
jgi:luciferase family oxidoreductase group 1